MPNEPAAASGYYEAIIKVRPSDPPEQRAREIADGLGYACALLMDEYGWRADAIAQALERVTDNLYDEEAQRTVSQSQLTARHGDTCDL